MNQIQTLSLLDKNRFKEGLNKIRFVFRLTDFDLNDKDILKFYYEQLKDLEDYKFSFIIDEIVKNEAVIYPHTNIIALVRGYYQKDKKFEQRVIMRETNTGKKIEDYLNNLSKEKRQEVLNKAEELSPQDINMIKKVEMYLSLGASK